MGYYRGDYYRGDYYRGDPGIFQTIGKVIGGVAKTVGGIVGGPIGAVLRVGGGILSPGGSPVSQPVPAFAGVPQMGGQPVPGMVGTVQRFLPGGQTGYGPGTACVKKDGTPRRIRRDGKCWKRPSMNVGNARAAHRAVTRIKGVRRLLQSIEREMPHRKAHAPAAKRGCGCK